MFTLCGLIASVPFDEIQNSYMQEYYRIKYEPIRRIQATYKYIEDVEDGAIPEINNEDYKKYLDKTKIDILPQNNSKK